MTPVLIVVKCPLPNLEAVIIHYDMMASDALLEQFRRTLGRERDGVVDHVDNWPAGMGDDPWGKDAPVGFRTWAANQGLMRALVDFANDPNWLTA